MHITVERVTRHEPFEEAQNMVLARFTIHDAEPVAWEAERDIRAEIRAMSRLNRTLLDLTPTTAPPSGGPDDVWVVIPMPRLLVEDDGFNLAEEIAPEVAEAYVYQLADRARRLKLRKIVRRRG